MAPIALPRPSFRRWSPAVFAAGLLLLLQDCMPANPPPTPPAPGISFEAVVDALFQALRTLGAALF